MTRRDTTDNQNDCLLTCHSERSEESPSSGTEEIPRFARNDMRLGFIFRGARHVSESSA
jgi:hypothetical protein